MYSQAAKPDAIQSILIVTRIQNAFNMLADENVPTFVSSTRRSRAIEICIFD